MAEGSGLLNRRTGQLVPGVQIPPSPPFRLPTSTTPFSFPITGTPNIPVAVEACANLSAGTWDRLLTTNLPPAGILEFTDTPDSTSHPSRFYRVVAP